MKKVVTGVGFLASVAIAIVSYQAGTLDVLHAGEGRPGFFGAPRWIYLIALSVLFGCWLLLGRDVLRRGNPEHWQPIAHVGALWSVPILGAAPIASRDVWAYGGQADLYRHDLDPYAHGPIGFLGHYLPYISTEWRDQASPYGPVWMVISATIVALAGSHVLVTVIATRVVCALGLLMIVLTAPRLARTFGGSPALATWLFCANPVIVVVTLGGPHNDLLVGGLITLALWFAVLPGPVWRSLVVPAVILALATMIKLPAACALAFLPYLWLRFAPAAAAARERRHAIWELSAAVAAVAAATALLMSAVSGLGFGWVHQLNSNSSGAIMFSVPVLAAFVWTQLFGPGAQLSQAAQVHPHVTSAASAVIALALLGLWLSARRHDAPRLLAIALALGVVASTTIHPWYAGWTLVIAAVVLTSRRVVLALAVLASWSALCVVPNGSSYLAKPPGILIAVVVAAVTTALLRSPSPPSGPDSASIRGRAGEEATD